MARTNVRFIEAHNAALDLCAGLDVGASLPSENGLADRLGVSRTVVRGVLTRLRDEGLLRWAGREKTLVRRPLPADRLAAPVPLLSVEALEDRFLDWILRRDVPPGTTLNITKLSRQFGVAPHTLQEFLSSLLRFGIVERRKRGGWVLRGFTPGFAVELSEFRTLLELEAVRQLIDLPEEHPVWQQLAEIEADHRALLTEIDTRYHDFSRLDERFHMAINGVVTNRFVAEFRKLISLIFHYHFQWNKSDERLRNEAAIEEHLAYLDALRSRDLDRALAAGRAHLATSKQTLLKSLRVQTRAE
ncbi:GntR family transcriptional regulator [Jannaschia marina]|uniref:GntR family transcriptional regulator n=1 Tax=Jannaschia marina TaxID=2741674 RepID=UPI0015CC3840|nr:GntR family transcriptional regulator [Jannaschia marina]